MEKKRFLVLDHQPDPALFAELSTTLDAEFSFASGFLQAIAQALRSRPTAVWVRRDLPWLPQGGVPAVFLESTLFSETQLVLFTPDVLRGAWPSRNMSRPMLWSHAGHEAKPPR
jgi:hypothetical protein